ncbi:hypothetical protein ACQ4LE_008894 [Meloidogyne hapla]|uniref:Uncharacterized protein n=1 Tax=Meloidogyne hapla TaxID=6305 RepID=A0A1I8BE15_MELHA
MPCQLPLEGIDDISDDVFSYMCNLAMEKCSEKGEKKKASCGGAAMRKRLLIKNFVAQMLSQEKQTRTLQQQYLDGREYKQNSSGSSSISWTSSHLADDRHMEREEEDEMEEIQIKEESNRVEEDEKEEEVEDSDEVEGEEEEGDDEEEEEEEEETAVAALLASKKDKKEENSFRPRYKTNNSDEDENFLLEEENKETISIINNNNLSSTPTYSLAHYSTNYGNWPNQLNEEKVGEEEDEFQKVPIQQTQFYAVENSLLSGNKDFYNGTWHFYGGIDTTFDSLNGGLLTENLMLNNDQQNEHIDKLLEEDGNTTKLFLMERAAEPLMDEMSEHSQQHLVGLSSMVPYIMKFTNEDHLFYQPQEGENQQNSRCLTNLDNARLIENENNQHHDIFESRKRPWFSQSAWSHFEENNNGVCDDNNFEQHQQFSPLCCGFLQLQPFGNSSGTAQTCGDSTNEPLMKRVKL